MMRRRLVAIGGLALGQTIAMIMFSSFFASISLADSFSSASLVVETFAVKRGDRGHYETGDADRLFPSIATLRPLHQTLPDPKPGDWLAEHDERGQSFRQYLAARPVTPTGRRAVIYVQPIGKFTREQREIVRLAAKYLSIFMNRSVKIFQALPLSVIPNDARRRHPDWGVPQIKTTYILDQVLKPRLPDDAAAYIAFTASDLWPQQGWNFVFGQASLRDRVGVWSIYRNGDPARSQAAYLTCLRRTLRTASHETGHMFSLLHCTAYQCNLCGSNSRAESDRHPLYLCPECQAKICWATGTVPKTRFRRLAAFCKQHGLDEEHDYYQQAIAALQD